MLRAKKTIFRYLSLLIVLIGTVAILYLLFGPVLLRPNGFMFATSGDGLNIYFSADYFINHVAEGFIHTGFSYPYGNHLVYDDVNPLLSMTVRSLKTWFPNIGQYTVGIINSSLFLGFLLAALFLYFIFRRTHLPDWYAVPAALLVTFFSPQVERLTGHLTLSYVCYVPMVWYVLIRCFEASGKQYGWMLAYIALVSAFSFIHPYYFLIGAGFLLAYLLVHALQHRSSWKQLWPKYALLFVASVLPVVILKGWEALTISGAQDFVKYPYGFLLFTSSFKQIFFSSHDPLYSFWDKVFKIKPYEWEEWLKWEGVAYVGVIGLAILLFSTIRFIYLLSRKQWNRVGKPVLPATLRTSIWASTLLLIWAMGYPFKLWPELLDVLGFVRQFRSQGRLTWPFFYVFLTWGLYLIYASFRILHQQDRFRISRIGGMLILALALGIWSVQRWVNLWGDSFYYGFMVLVLGLGAALWWTYYAKSKVALMIPGPVLLVAMGAYWILRDGLTLPKWLPFVIHLAFIFYLIYGLVKNDASAQPSLSRRLSGIITIAMAFLIWGMDASGPLKEKSIYIKGSDTRFAYPQWSFPVDSTLKAHDYQVDDFQAILSFPFYHFGTEKFVHTSFHSTRHSFAISHVTGLPIINTLVARAPLSPSLSILQLMSEPYIKKHWLDSLPSDKPLLLIYSDEPPPLNEQRIIAASDSITRIGEVNFAKLDLSAFPDEREKIRADFLANKDSMVQRDQWYLSADTTPVHFDGFGNGPLELGEKVRYEHKDKAILFNEVLPAKQGEIDMKVSFWLKIDIESEYLPAVIMEQYDKDLMVNQVPVECKFTKDVYKDWVRVEMDFFLQKPTNRIYMYTFTPAEHFSVDNILFQPKGTDVYAWDGERLFLNNYLID